jgi:hypothetical protein
MQAETGASPIRSFDPRNNARAGDRSRPVNNTHRVDAMSTPCGGIPIFLSLRYAMQLIPPDQEWCKNLRERRRVCSEWSPPRLSFSRSVAPNRNRRTVSRFDAPVLRMMMPAGGTAAGRGIQDPRLVSVNSRGGIYILTLSDNRVGQSAPRGLLRKKLTAAHDLFKSSSRSAGAPYRSTEGEKSRLIGRLRDQFDLPVKGHPTFRSGHFIRRITGFDVIEARRPLLRNPNQGPAVRHD